MQNDLEYETALEKAIALEGSELALYDFLSDLKKNKCRNELHLINKYKGIFARFLRLDRNLFVSAFCLDILLFTCQDNSFRGFAEKACKVVVDGFEEFHLRQCALTGLASLYWNSKDMELTKLFLEIYLAPNEDETIRCISLKSTLEICLGLTAVDIMLRPPHGFKNKLKDFQNFKDEINEVIRFVQG